MKNTMKIFFAATIMIHLLCIPAQAVAGDVDESVYPIPRDAAVEKFIYLFSKNIKCTSDNLAKYRTNKSECKSRLKLSKRICPSLVTSNDVSDIKDEKELKLVSYRIGTCIVVTLYGRKYSNQASDAMFSPSDG